MDDVSDVHLERQSASLMIGQPPAIHPHFGAAVNPLEAEFEPPFARRRAKSFPIAAYSLGRAESLHLEMGRYLNLGPGPGR